MNDSKIIPPNSTYSFTVDAEHNNMRLDIFLSNQIKTYSRSFFKKLIEDNLVSVNNKIINKSSHYVKENDEIIVKFPEAPKKDDLKQIDDLNVEIVFEHPDFLIINKPAGLLVHAASSNDTDVNLVDWLRVKFNEISQIDSTERPGIVHRLDMNTSGLMIVARNNYSHMKFGEMFKDRLIKKTYLAIIQGQLSNDSGTIDYYIMRHPSGNKMTCLKSTLKMPFARGDIRNAHTDYKVLKRYKDYCLVEAKPVTGRTHQIRVHFACIGHPLVGDILYGKKSKLIDRHALHASKLEFEYEGQQFSFETDLPQDMKKLL